ncbi:hypothetical protein ABH976_007606 [Bradyrhizobium ottawaense]|uniref:hypothetical protein n=1 Tax=Bradyrhizobium ottawaense TaxID=931866 RepID=UPI003511AA0A
MPPHDGKPSSVLGDADDVDLSNNKALRHARLPQYFASDDFRNRFMEAAHVDDSEIARAMPPSTGGFLTVEQSEINNDLLGFFVDRKSDMEAEFVSELSEKIGEAKTRLFCDTIACEWSDGLSKRLKGNVLALKRSVKNYLETIIRGLTIDRIVTLSDIGPGDAMLTTQELACLLTLNDRMMHVLIDDWIERRPGASSISRSDIFYRRGIVLQELFEHEVEYFERDFISSYTLAMSVADKFSQNVKKGQGGDSGDLECGLRLLPRSHSLLLRLHSRHGSETTRDRNDPRGSPRQTGVPRNPFRRCRVPCWRTSHHGGGRTLELGGVWGPRQPTSRVQTAPVARLDCIKSYCSADLTMVFLPSGITGTRLFRS